MVHEVNDENCLEVDIMSCHWHVAWETHLNFSCMTKFTMNLRVPGLATYIIFSTERPNKLLFWEADLQCFDACCQAIVERGSSLASPRALGLSMVTRWMSNVSNTWGQFTFDTCWKLGLKQFIVASIDHTITCK